MIVRSKALNVIKGPAVAFFDRVKKDCAEKKVPIGRVSDAVDAASTTAVSTMVKKCFTDMIDGIDNGKFTDHVMVGPCQTPGFLANQVIAAAMAPSWWATGPHYK